MYKQLLFKHSETVQTYHRPTELCHTLTKDIEIYVWVSEAAFRKQIKLKRYYEIVFFFKKKKEWIHDFRDF